MENQLNLKKFYDGTSLTIGLKDVSGEVSVEFTRGVSILKNDSKAEIDHLLMKMQMSNTEKWELSRLMHKSDSLMAVLAKMFADGCDETSRMQLLRL